MSNPSDDAFAELMELLEDWAYDHEWLVRYPDKLARDAADIIFRDLLHIPEVQDAPDQ